MPEIGDIYYRAYCNPNNPDNPINYEIWTVRRLTPQGMHLACSNGKTTWRKFGTRYVSETRERAFDMLYYRSVAYQQHCHRRLRESEVRVRSIIEVRNRLEEGTYTRQELVFLGPSDSDPNILEYRLPNGEVFAASRGEPHPHMVVHWDPPRATRPWPAPGGESFRHQYYSNLTIYPEQPINNIMFTNDVTTSTIPVESAAVESLRAALMGVIGEQTDDNPPLEPADQEEDDIPLFTE